MRAKTIFIASLLILCWSINALALDTKYGEGVNSHEAMLISELLDNADDYVGKTVRVEGTVVGVCSHRGCWANIASDREGELVRIKVADGVIVFPPELQGETVIAEGVWTANELDLETTKRVCAHNAEKAGKTFDEKSVTECMTVYQITCSGAELVKNPELKGHEHDEHHGEHEKSGHDADKGHDEHRGHGHDSDKGRGH